MEKKVVFTSGYTSPISQTKDFGIKEFPPCYSKKLRDSLETFCYTQTFFQKEGLEQIVLLGYPTKSKMYQPLALLFATVEYSLKDHQNRPTFLLSGNIITHETTQSLHWQALPINKRSEEIWQKFSQENISLQEAYEILKTWPEFQLYQKNLQEILEKKIIASFWKSYLCSIVFLCCIALLYFLYQRQNIENLSQRILKLQKQNAKLSSQLSEQKKQNMHTQLLLEYHYQKITTNIPENVWKGIIHSSQYNEFKEILKKDPQKISIDKNIIEKNKKDKYLLNYLGKILLLYQKEISKELQNSRKK